MLPTDALGAGKPKAPGGGTQPGGMEYSLEYRWGWKKKPAESVRKPGRLGVSQGCPCRPAMDPCLDRGA